MPAMALSRVAARVVESGPDGENLAPGAWQRLEALPDPRSPQGRIYPLACLVAVAVCAFTAAGNDRFTAVGQWIKRAGQADLARLRAPWAPVAGRYRAPDEKTIRIVLDRLDPRALTRALLGPRPRRRRGAHLRLGDVLGAQERLPDAEKAYREAIRLDPADAHASFRLGSLLERQGRLAEAEVACREAIRLDPNDVYGYEVLAEVNCLAVIS